MIDEQPTGFESRESRSDRNAARELLRAEKLKITETEAVEIATEIFKVDMEAFKNYLAGNQEDIRIAGLIVNNPLNPEGVPILIIRPNLDIYEDSANSGFTLAHADMYSKWQEQSEADPYSKRAKLFNLIKSERGVNGMVDIVLRLTKNDLNEQTLIISSGWSRYSYGYEREDKDKRIQQMSAYGVDLIVDYDKNVIDVEELVEAEKMAKEAEERDKLNMQMPEYIDYSAKKLETVLSHKAVERYKRLAKKFYLELNPDKNSISYMHLLDYQDLLKKLN